ncbi:MAG: hypothetical protein IKS93_03420, partial [Methanobrevibacter sp.]|nr:hypothetical protein [Methanobrevibacter sp.]
VKTVTYEIKKNIKKTKVKVEGDKITVRMKDKILTQGKDYTVDELDYSGVGIHKIIINGTGEFIGQKGILIDKVN